MVESQKIKQSKNIRYPFNASFLSAIYNVILVTNQ